MAGLREERIGGQREVLIYALTEPGTDIVRYVGKTVRSPRKRHKEHLADATNPRLPVHRWIKSQYARGSWSCLWHLERVPESEDWAARERWWIAKFRSEGARLLNLTDGGEGLAGLPRSKETRAKISAGNRRGAFFNCETCGSEFWRKPKDIRVGHNRFCSRECYQRWQLGKPKAIPLSTQVAGVAASAAIKRARTHCRQGHPLSGDNLRFNKRGARLCIECQREASRAYRARNR